MGNNTSADREQVKRETINALKQLINETNQWIEHRERICHQVTEIANTVDGLLEGNNKTPNDRILQFRNLDDLVADDEKSIRNLETGISAVQGKLPGLDNISTQLTSSLRLILVQLVTRISAVTSTLADDESKLAASSQLAATAGGSAANASLVCALQDIFPGYMPGVPTAIAHVVNDWLEGHQSSDKLEDGSGRLRRLSQLVEDTATDVGRITIELEDSCGTLDRLSVNSGCCLDCLDAPIQHQRKVGPVSAI